jgi:transcriptional regulator with PAS, ATPase and Fis domain
LLRVLQEQEFEHLGSTLILHVTVRVVAATHRDLLQMVKEKAFRADLFYRLSVFPVALPPLRERREDIPSLVRHFITKYAIRLNKVVEEVAPETMDAMVGYDWPGNIRQLQNFIEHGVIVSEGSVFRPPLDQLKNRTDANSLPRARKTLEDATREHILQTLQETKWMVGGRRGAAARLGIARTTLLSKMRRLGIESAGDDELIRGAGGRASFAYVA